MISVKQVMASIAKAVLKETLDLLVKKGRGCIAGKRKYGDVTNGKLRGWIVNEMDKVNSKLDAIASSDLGASELANKALKTETSSDINISHTATAAVNTSSLTEELKNLDLTDEARREATKACINEALSKIVAIKTAIARKRSERVKVENRASALAACRSCIEKLHLMPDVKENFNVEFTKGVKSIFSKDERREIISTVCQINRVMYDVTQLVGEGKELLLWPCIEIGANERIDPLRDSRVAKMLRKLEMGDCSLAWSFGQEGDEKDERLHSAGSIDTNTLGHFFVADHFDRCIKVFDTTGKFLYSFHLPDDDIATGTAAIAIDSDDNVYAMGVCVSLAIGLRRGSSPMASSHVFMFDKQGNFHHKFPVGYRFIGNVMRVKDDHSLLVSGRSAMVPSLGATRSDNGALIGVLSTKELKRVRDMTVVDDGRIMVLDCESCVHVFSDIVAVNDVCSELTTSSDYLYKFPVADGACAIAFHWMSGHVIVASKSKSPDGPSQLSIYSKDGAFERSIQLELEKNDNISAAAVTADGRICVCVESEARDGTGKGSGKVLVF